MRILLGVLIVGFIWDLVTSFLGIAGLLGISDLNKGNIGIYMTAIVGSGLILGLSISAKDIWSEDKTDEIYLVLKIVHVTAIIFDAYTSFLGTAQNILLHDSRTAFLTIGFAEVWEMTNFEQKIALLFVTVLVTMSPIAFSRLRD